jgi:cytochrome c nitrite reductase small subunit
MDFLKVKKYLSIWKEEWWGVYSPRAVLWAVGGGGLLGLVFFLVYISNFFSYLSDRPETCINCHIMGTEYATWQHSSHREVANCNDCHVPHDNVFKKYLFKSMDGLRHSAIFTLRAESQAIIMKPAGVGAVEGNCKRCHQNLFQQPSVGNNNYYSVHFTEGKRCWDCHRDTPHGTVRSLSAAPYAWVPGPAAIFTESTKGQKKVKK